MGYETKMYVVEEYTFETGKYRMGNTIAMLELCKCGYDGPVGRLIAKHTKLQKNVDKPFAIYANKPERQQEAVEFLRENSDVFFGRDRKGRFFAKPQDKYDAKQLTELIDHLEDGEIVTDKYGDNFGVIEIDDMIEALEQEQQKEPYRRFAIALAMLKSIKENFVGDRLKILTYGH